MRLIDLYSNQYQICKALDLQLIILNNHKIKDRLITNKPKIIRSNSHNSKIRAIKLIKLM